MPLDPDRFDDPPVAPRPQTVQPPPPIIVAKPTPPPAPPPPVYNPSPQPTYQQPYKSRPASSGVGGKMLAAIAALVLIGVAIWFIANQNSKPVIVPPPAVQISRLNVDAKILSAMSALGNVPPWLQEALPGRNVTQPNYPPPDNVQTTDRCPGEGCGYHRWLAMKELPLFDGWTSPNPQQVYTVADRETVTAISGVFITTKPGVEEILEPLNIAGMEADAGDLVYPLMSLGEGWMRAFFRGQMLDLNLYAGGRQVTRKVREIESVWWAQIRTSTGVVGWTNAASSFSGQSESGGVVPYVVARNGQQSGDQWDYELEVYVPNDTKDASIKIGDTVLPWGSQEGVQKLQTGPILRSGETYAIELFGNNGQQLLAKTFLKPDAPQQEQPPSSPPQAANYIPSVSANVKEILFFESGSGQPPKESRRYEKQFASKGTRFINWELDLIFPRHQSDMTFAVDSVWYGPSGAVVARQTTNVSIRSDWTNAHQANGWGSAAGGSFTPGSYRIDFLVGGTKVSSETFAVYEGEAPPSMYIQAVDATVSPLQFFPSAAAAPPKDQRRYAGRFSRSTVRYRGCTPETQKIPSRG